MKRVIGFVLFAAALVLLPGCTEMPADAGSRLRLPATAYDGRPAPLTAPVITVGPQSNAVHVFESVSFNVTASGNPAPTYQWKKEGSDISAACSAVYTITSVRLADAGRYSVIATNSEGSDTSGAAQLIVLENQPWDPAPPVLPPVP